MINCVRQESALAEETKKFLADDLANGPNRGDGAYPQALWESPQTRRGAARPRSADAAARADCAGPPRRRRGVPGEASGEVYGAVEGSVIPGSRAMKRCTEPRFATDRWRARNDGIKQPCWRSPRPRPELGACQRRDDHQRRGRCVVAEALGAQFPKTVDVGGRRQQHGRLDDVLERHLRVLKQLLDPVPDAMAMRLDVPGILPLTSIATCPAI